MSTIRLRHCGVVGSLAALALLTGCFETTQEFTVNPDGSGKVVHESTYQNVDLSGGQKSTEATARAAVAELVRKAKGVEAWRDISYNVLEDGRIHFKGTAYFRNLSDLDLPNQTMLEFDWIPGGNGSATLSLRQKNDEAKAGRAQAVKLSPDERARKIKEGRAKYQQAKPMMTMILGTMKHDVVFHLPGQPAQRTGFTRNAAGALELHFDGARMLSAMETLLNNDDWIARNSGSFEGGGGPPMDEDANLIIFGDKRPARVTVTDATAPLFDYEAEVAAAQESFAAFQKEVGAAPAPIVAPAKGGDLKGVRVVGVRTVATLDEKLELQPFGSEPGVTLALLLELPGSVHAVTDEGALDSAVGSDGGDLLPESDFQRKFHFPKLSADKSAVLVEAPLKSPAEGVTALKELAGHIQYTVAGEPVEEDLGFAKIAPGAKGKALGAEIVSVTAESGAAKTIEIHLLIDPDSLKALYLVRGKNRTELERRGYSGGNADFTFTYHSENGFPAGAKLVAETYGDMQTYEARFNLEDVALPAALK